MFLYCFTVFRVLILVFDPLNNWEWGRASIRDFTVWKEAKPFQEVKWLAPDWSSG